MVKVADKIIDGILWPVFHYHANDMAFEEEPWDAYVEVNRIFSERVAQDVKDNDIVWVHDYHLMLMPQMLLEELGKLNKTVKNLKIGFFLHIPFPSSQEFFKLPYRNDILRALLASDLIGFHTYDYARHFLSACHKALGLDTFPSGVRYKGRTIHVGAFPIGINPEKELNAIKQDKVQQRIQQMREGTFKDRSVIVSVDRLDYIKGLAHKFHAFDMFLEANKDQVGKAVLLQIVVPSRQDVKEYQVLRSHISELAGRINAKYGNIDYQPIVYRYTSVSHDELVALYGIAEVCLVTSTRDGMNLVSYEYIACQQEGHGQLVVSEFAGAAQSMKGCIIINPWDIGETMDGLRTALTLTPKEREANWKKMWDYVDKYTSAAWGMSFIDELTRIGEVYSEVIPRVRPREPSDNLDGAADEVSRLDMNEVSNQPVIDKGEVLTNGDVAHHAESVAPVTVNGVAAS